MIQTIRNAWSVPELRKKILFTIFALLIFRLGSAIPVPYINAEQLRFYLEAQSGTILGLMKDVYKRQGEGGGSLRAKEPVGGLSAGGGDHACPRAGDFGR